MENLIIIPTYDEAENVERLTADIFKDCPDTDILFVDDNSPDGTGEILERLKKNNDKIKVLHRTGKLGFASAYIEGFKWAINKGYKYICEMDSDFSHSPSVLPLMFKYIREYDAVIGSRYVKNGGTKNWGIPRKIISYCGNMYARIILFSPIHDLTGGFVCWRRELLEAVSPDTLKSKGYCFQIELKNKAQKAGFSFIEIPILFEDRTAGKSKMNRSIFWEAFIRVIKIRLGD